MTRPKVGAVTIGQAPRPDLLEPLLSRAGSDIDVIEVGALDGLTIDRLPAPRPDRGPNGSPAYPLTTRLHDGTPVTLDEADLEPLVEQAIDRAEDAGADVTLLLCAGGFLDATARGVLIRPFEAAVSRLHDLRARRLGVVVPYAGQAEPAGRKWAELGFEPTTIVGALTSIDVPQPASVDALVLDYVGHPSIEVEALRARSPLPVVDLGQAAADAVVAALADRAEHAAAGRR